MYDISIIPKEFNQDESIDFHIGQMEDAKFIEEKALDHVPDPLKVMKMNGFSLVISKRRQRVP